MAESITTFIIKPLKGSSEMMSPFSFPLAAMNYIQNCCYFRQCAVRWASL